MKMHLGAQIYTVREFVQNDADFRSTMKALAEQGFRYVQISGIGNVSAETVRDATAENGLKIIMTHYSPAKIRDNTDEVIAYHRLIGCDAVGIGSSPYPRTREGYERLCADFTEPAKRLREAGIKFLYHNHHLEFEKFGGETAMDIILKNTDPDDLMLIFDTYWAQTGGIDCVDFIKKHGDRIFATHLKDMTVIDGSATMTEMLTGNMNFDGILAACSDVGIKWHFIEQDIVRMNALDSLKISRDNLIARYDMD